MKNNKNELQAILLECDRLKSENENLKSENQMLKKLLAIHQIPLPISIENNDYYNIKKSKKDKINERLNLFKTLFRGRSDVYAVRWESKDGKSGYTPARQNKGKFHRPLPLTDQVIFDHLMGNQTIGLYPLLKDNTCWFLATDFDKKDWQSDVLDFVHTCETLRIPSYIERSRSGNGGHVWIFFNQPISASLARRLGQTLMTKTRKKRGQSQLSSFDRFFPNQDTLTKGGFGNLIAFPLQGSSRKKNNSVFVDNHFVPFPNQWEFLADVKRMTQKEIELIINQHEVKHPTFPMIEEKSVRQELSGKEVLKPLTELKVLQKNGLFIEKESVPLSLLQQIRQLAIIKNPDYFKAKAKRFSTHHIPSEIDCSDDEQGNLVIPRGRLVELEEMLNKQSIQLKILDQTFHGSPLNVEFCGELRPQQQSAMDAIIKHHTGILSATTGFGKTVVGAALIAKRKTNTLILVHRKPLIDQWRKSLSQFLSIDEKEIGQIGGGKQKAFGLIDIATIQSLNRNGEVKELVKDYGQVIVDECHHISAFSFETVLRKVESRFVFGLTATPTRRDGLHPIMQMQLGPIRYKVKAKNQVKLLPFEQVLIPRYTHFKSQISEANIQELYSELVKNESRNTLIFDDVLRELEKGFVPLILTERVEHVEELANRFKGFAKNIIILKGGMKKSEEKARLDQLESLGDTEERLIIATGKYIGEGFDHARLDALFLTMPLSWKGTLEQYVGRLHRFHDDKTKVKVYDYVDHKEPILQNMYEKRLKGYKSLGYQIHDGTKTTEVKGVQMELF